MAHNLFTVSGSEKTNEKGIFYGLISFGQKERRDTCMVVGTYFSHTDDFINYINNAFVDMQVHSSGTFFAGINGILLKESVASPQGTFSVLKSGYFCKHINNRVTLRIKPREHNVLEHFQQTNK